MKEMNNYKELTDLLEQKDMWNYGWAKPGQIFINQGRRLAAIVCDDSTGYNVAYKMPNGRIYAKNVNAQEAIEILHIAMYFKLDGDTGEVEGGFGF
jgi:hypothetical protein